MITRETRRERSARDGAGDATVFGHGAGDSANDLLTNGPKTKQAREPLSLGPADSLVAGAGFEPATFGLAARMTGTAQRVGSDIAISNTG